jgi:hypothetical protein
MDAEYIYIRVIEYLDQLFHQEEIPPNTLHPRIRDAYHIEILASSALDAGSDLPVGIIDTGGIVVTLSRVVSNIKLIGNDSIPQLLTKLEKYLLKISQSDIDLQQQLEVSTNPKKHNAQFNQRAMIWRDLRVWIKAQRITPTTKECLEELKKKPSYLNKIISTKRISRTLKEGFAGEYEDTLNNV